MMEFEIANRPSFTTAEVSLEEDEQVLAEAGAMISHSGGIEMQHSKGIGDRQVRPAPTR